MNSKYCVMKEAGLTENTKRAVLAAEVLRRLFNMDEEVGRQVRDDVINKFSNKMRRSGYNSRERQLATMNGLIGYVRRKAKCREEGTPLYRDGSKGVGSRIKKELTGKTTWYMNKKANNKWMWQQGRKGGEKEGVEVDKGTPASVMFVERTPGGELTTMIRL